MSSRWSSAKGSAFFWSLMISKRRSASRTKSICCRKGRARASPNITRYRFRGRAIRSTRARTPPSRRSTRGSGQTFPAKWITGRRRPDASRSPLRLDAPACRVRGSARGLGGGRTCRHAQSIVSAEPEQGWRGARRAVLGWPHLATSRRNVHRRAWRSRTRHRRWHSARCRGGPRSVHRGAARAGHDCPQRHPTRDPRAAVRDLARHRTGLQDRAILHSRGSADLLHRVHRNPAGGPQACRAGSHAGRRPLGARATRLPAVGRVLGARQSENRDRLCFHGRLRGGVRGGDARPGLSLVVCAEHLQRRPDVRADSSDPRGCPGDLRACRPVGKVSAALELSVDHVAVSGLLTRIREQPREVLDAIAKSMNVRASEPAMQAICARYLAQIALPEGARVLEVGCGNGAATRLIMQHMGPAQLVGIDPSSALIDMAGATFVGEPRVSFAIGDATATGHADACFDLVVAHTVFSHLADPEGALTEARRVLRPGGQLVIFDGDFATLTVALFDGDPLQTAAAAVLRNLVHAPYIMRRLPALLAAAGFSVQSVEPHGYVQMASPDYLLTLLSRGAAAAVQAGEIGRELVDSFDREARRRVANGTFYGAMLFLSLTARKAGK